MSSLLELFNKYDYDEIGEIDIISFKRILNLIDYPIKNLDESKNYYTFDDVKKYLTEQSNIDSVSKDKLYKKLQRNYNDNNVQFIMNNLNNSTNSNKINIDQMNLFIDNLFNK